MESKTHNQGRATSKDKHVWPIFSRNHPGPLKRIGFSCSAESCPEKFSRVVPLPQQLQKINGSCLYINADKQRSFAALEQARQRQLDTRSIPSKLVLHTQNRVQPGRVARFSEPSWGSFRYSGLLGVQKPKSAKSRNLGRYGSTTAILSELPGTLCPR